MAGVKYTMECWGAQGGTLNVSSSWAGQGGRGGYVSGLIYLAVDRLFYAYVGGHPIDYNYSGYGNGGWNGGGDVVGAAAGGATDIRLVDGNWNNVPSLCSRIIVAGAGGGADVNVDGGYGGGLTAGAGALDVATTQQPQYSSYSTAIAAYIHATGGEQKQGGRGGSTFPYKGSQTGPAGTFGSGGSNISVDGGGGSGGYYGGGHSSCPWASGGGGSSFISGHIGCNAINASVDNLANISHTGQPNHYSNYVFESNSTVMIDGNGYSWTNARGALQLMPNPTSANSNYSSGTGHTGDGYARITCKPYN